MEPVRLSMAVRGKGFDPSEEKSPPFVRQLQLANYFVAQLHLMAEMCQGRSYNCIRELEKSFSYALLVTMSSSMLLPYAAQGASCRLLLALYMDR